MGAPHIGLVLHPRSDPTEVANKVVAWAGAHGKEVLVEEKDGPRCPRGVVALPTREFVTRAGALISLGGDGTMLGALRLVAAAPVPVLGVNLGRLGFLVEVEPAGVDAALEQLTAGTCTIEEHSALLLCDTHGEVVAFNDVALCRVPGGGPVDVQLAVEDRRLGAMRGDALVVSTPVGSTAYAYAAGGPVVSPGLDAMIVAAVAPMSGIARPMVLSADEPLVVEVARDGGSPALEIDGTLLRRVEPGARIDVCLRPRSGLVVRLDAARHQRRSAVKLSLLDLPFLPDEIRELAP